MQEAGIPLQENARLAELRALHLLDALPEERFDRITRIAQRLFQVPIALISLVDEHRQFFKSRQGLAATETPRRVSFCAHAILQDEIFLINNALEDPRFHDNPLVTGEPFIRFYAGFPLHGPHGHKIGSFCLIDQKPRQLDADQLATLRELGHWVQMELSVNAIDEVASRLQGEQAMIDEMHDLNIQLAATTRLQQAILNGSNFSLISADIDGNVVLFNAGAERMLGYCAEEMMGQSVAKLHLPEEMAQHAARLSAETGRLVMPGLDGFTVRARQGGVDEQEWTYVCKDGSHLPVMLSITALYDGNHEVSGYLGIAWDLTERKRIEHMKTEFISTVSHELRTPLTSIRGALGLLASGAVGPVAPRAQQMLDIAKNNCERLVRLINDILDIEKIESGNMRFDMNSQALQPLIAQAIGMTQGYATQYQVHLREVALPQDVQVVVDSDRFLQVLVNLLSNACKFSRPGGEVVVSTTLQGLRVRVAVQDQGAGIADEFRSRIFQKFAQSDSSDTRSKGGTGLGLNISKSIMEHMQGAIAFDSTPGVGSTFYIELPFQAAWQVPAQDGASILIVEDDADIAKLLSLMLGQGGWRCDIAADAATARRLLVQHSYRAMTLDLALPDEDGLSLLRWLRGHGALADLPVVVVSAQADVGLRSMQGSAVGVADWLAKPIDEQRLLSVLRKLIPVNQTEPPRVLHIDDDPDLVQVVAAMLEPNFTMVQARNLQQARQRLEGQHFDLILLDLGLPDGNGADLLGSLPALNLTTPVVIFSAQEADTGLLDKVRGALVKSRTSNEQLLATLHKLIERCFVAK